MSYSKYSRILLAVCLAAPMAIAQVPSYKIRTRSITELQADERSLVSQWCRLDFEGARLSPDGWKKFDPLTNLKANPDFSAIYVVSRYQFLSPDRVSMDASATFNVIGKYEIGIGYTPQSDTRYVNFHFSDKEGDLQIVDIDPAQPSVSKPAMIAWLKSQIEATKSAADKITLQNALNQLQPPPPAPPKSKTDEGSSSSKPNSK